MSIKDAILNGIQEHCLLLFKQSMEVASYVFSAVLKFRIVVNTYWIQLIKCLPTFRNLNVNGKLFVNKRKALAQEMGAWGPNPESRIY